MTVKHVNFCVDLDKRDSKGRPRVTKTPDTFHFSNSDLVKLSISILENGYETDLATSCFYVDRVKPLRVKQT